ncbi:hypothetical protein [Rhizorhabdus argentea]|uniref:hypothetical protein n=1 Tax=Rhizorhabdus argentea TaxID=1387174 RepID=UPI0030EB2835
MPILVVSGSVTAPITVCCSVTAAPAARIDALALVDAEEAAHEGAALADSEASSAHRNAKRLDRPIFHPAAPTAL